MKDELDNCEPFRYESSLPSGGLLVDKHHWGLFIIPLLAMLVVIYNDTFNTMPVLDALECACLQSGKHCLASQMQNKSQWDLYWAHTAHLPGPEDGFDHALLSFA